MHATRAAKNAAGTLKLAAAACSPTALYQPQVRSLIVPWSSHTIRSCSGTFCDVWMAATTTPGSIFASTALHRNTTTLPTGLHQPWSLNMPRTMQSRGAANTADDPKARKAEEQRWKLLSKATPEDVNPCNSPYHPAARLEVIQMPDEGGQLSVQDAYSPSGKCFGCGPKHDDGIGLKSYRRKQGGLTAVVQFHEKHEVCLPQQVVHPHTA
mmetsp:Transcript_14699/g.41369  ORF Transcript_14699/g.41369 Transcript_14699/m.41369 type:complete len:211 (-) Transcript_14699:602-1234(-)